MNHLEVLRSVKKSKYPEVNNLVDQLIYLEDVVSFYKFKKKKKIFKYKNNN